MLTPVSREEFVEALVELLPTVSRGRPTEVNAARIDERVARYVAELRHGSSAQATYLLSRNGKRPSALAAVASSPFDEQILGVPVGKVLSLEVTAEAEARTAIRAADRAAIAMGFELLLARVAPDGLALPAMLASGWQAFGATILYAGTPINVRNVDPAIEVAESVEDVREAARLARLCFTDTHLSRDEGLDRAQSRALYEAWVKAEAERGATVLIARETRKTHERGRVQAVAVCRGNDLARQRLGLRQWHLHLLAVHPRARGTGLGLQIARAAMQTAQRAGAELVQTGVDTAAVAAQRIYTELGLLPRNSSFALHRWLRPR